MWGLNAVRVLNVRRTLNTLNALRTLNTLNALRTLNTLRTLISRYPETFQDLFRTRLDLVQFFQGFVKIAWNVGISARIDRPGQKENEKL